MGTDLLVKRQRRNRVTRIPVEKAHGEDATSADTGELTEQIRQLAFHLFESRGGGDGRDLDDWLEAERELILAPPSELVQRDGKFEIRMPAEGYEPGEIHVTALPGALVVKAASEQNAARKILLRTIDLPQPIDADRTTARLDKGILYVTAVRQKPEHELAAV
jgi:HSP20 family molecular chaperone IbpA